MGSESWEKWGKCDIIGSGSVAEWLKAHDSKSCRRASVSRVRIPPLPPKRLIKRNPERDLF